MLLGAPIFISGCGSSGCRVVGVRVAPPTATANHTAAAPDNGATFVASTLFGDGVCAVNASTLVSSNWTVSDPSVHLSAIQGPQVTATCTAALANPATITATAATGQMLTGQASLTCQ
ncbi:MAG TPA: hypothetical protein VFL42_13920 [Terriglobales bacterium]|jgi:hypothetical protein|nr:hypothetical protein [Terriglobales bacterium]